MLKFSKKKFKYENRKKKEKKRKRRNLIPKICEEKRSNKLKELVDTRYNYKIRKFGKFK